MRIEGKKLEKYKLISDFKHKQETKSVGGTLVVYYKRASLFHYSLIRLFFFNYHFISALGELTRADSVLEDQ